MPDIFDQVDAGPKTDIFDTVDADNLGEMRRREGRGEIAAGVPDNRHGIERVLGQYADQQAQLSPANPTEAAASLRGMKEGIQYAAPKLAGLTAGLATGGLAPGATATFLNLVKAGATSGLVQGATEEAVSQIVGASKPSATALVGHTLAGGTIGAAGGAVARVAAPVVSAGAELFSGAANPARRAVATLMRPFRSSASQIDAADARAVIQGATGIDVPVGVAEAIGNPGLAGKMTKGVADGAEFSIEDRDALKRAVAMAATRLRSTGVSADDLARDTIGLLENEMGAINAPAKQAVKDAAAELHPAIQKAYGEVQNQATAAVPGTAATPTAAGNDIRGHLSNAFNEVSDAENAAWSAAKAHPDYDQVTVLPIETKQWAEALKDNTLQVAPSPRGPGGPVASMYPEGTKAFVEAAADAAPNMSLEAMRRFRTKVGNSFGNDSIFPGISDYEKKSLYKAVSNDIEGAVQSLPTSQLKDALDTAAGFTRDKFSRFSGKPIESIVAEFGAEGGSGPAAIAARLEGKDGPILVNELKRAAGPTYAGQVDKTVRDYLYNQAAIAGRDPITGEISAAAIAKKIGNLAPELQAQYFPGLPRVTALAKRQAAIAGLKTKADGIMSNLSIDDPQLMLDALGPKPAADVTAKITDAFAKSAKAEAEFSGSVLGYLKNGDDTGIAEAVAKNPLRFVRSMTDGTFSPANTRKALDMIGKQSPTVLGQLQFHFVSELLETYVSAGGVNAGRIAHDLSAATPSTAAGGLRAQAEAVLGAGKVSHLDAVLKAFGELDRQGGQLTAASPVVDVAARGAGGIIGLTAGRALGIGAIGSANQFRGLVMLAPKLKYSFASYLLTTQELRKLAMTPISAVSRDQARQVVKGFTAFMVDKVSEHSPEAEELRDLDRTASK